jgi:hypothetical protein
VERVNAKVLWDSEPECLIVLKRADGTRSKSSPRYCGICELHPHGPLARCLFPLFMRWRPSCPQISDTSNLHHYFIS